MFKYRPESTCELVVYDNTGQMKNHIKAALRDYKTRWNESLADIIGVTDNLDELGFDHTVIVPEFISYSINPLRFKKLITVDAIQNLDMYTLRRAVVKTNVRVIKDINEAALYLDSLGPIFSFDTETAPAIESDVLSQKDLSLDVFRNQITMYSFAEDEENAVVIINENQEMEDLVLKFLTTTESKVIMHNASFDMKIVKYCTGKFIKNIEDTQLLAWAYINHADEFQSKVGLKELAGKVYGAWAVAKDLFGIENKYNPDLHLYSGIDAMATFFLWNEYSRIEDVGKKVDLSGLLPAPHPAKYEYTSRYFYENVMKPLIPNAINLMLNGIHLDMDKVAQLDEKLDTILDRITTSLAETPLIQEFDKIRYQEAIDKKAKKKLEKKRDVRYYLKDYKHTDTVMRSYVVNEYLSMFQDNGFEFDLSFWPTDVLPNGDTKWSITDIKKMRKVNALPLLDEIINKTISIDNPIVHKAMIKLAVYKTELYNASCEEEAKEVTLTPTEYKPFSPSSPQQKRKFFEWMNVAPLAFSKDSGEASWGREQLEELVKTTSNSELIEVLNLLIEHSQSSIIKTTFVEGFKKFNVNGVLHGNFKLAGAKSFRPTSNKVNLLNMPSTGSIYAQPIKECFVAPEGFIVAAIDYAALEDRVIANLSGDDNKLAVFTEGIDGHSLAATYYFPDKIADFVGPFTDNKEAARLFLDKTKEDKSAKALRQDSKPVTFKLAYGGYPDVDKGGTITQEIFDNYHNKMYPSISKMRDESITIARKQDYLHLGLGCKLRTDDVDKQGRTLFNALSQFWSVLTLITIAKINEAIEKEGYIEDIKVSASIYDSIYFIVKKDAKIIKWLNDTLIPIMTTDFMENQIVPNDANLELGTSWAKLKELGHNASLDEIQEILDELV